MEDGIKEITKNGARMKDGQEKEFDAIIFATGYKSNVPSWLKVIAKFKFKLILSSVFSFTFSLKLYS